MSVFTTQIRFICETAAGLTESEGYNSVQGIIEKSAPKIFDFDFPIFDEKYRLPLEIKILRHFYTREICEETVGLWKLRLQDRMNVIMPYYNKLYESELIKFNPLYDVDVLRDHNIQSNGKTNSENVKNTKQITDGTNAQTGKVTKNETLDKKINETSTVNGTNKIDESVTATGNNTTTDKGNVSKSGTAWTLYSDTPQGGVVGINRATDDIANNAYLTNATKNTSSENTTSSANSTNENTATQTTDGTNTENTTTATIGNNSDTTKGTIDTTDNLKIDTTVTGNENSTEQNTITNTEDYLEHVRGKQGSMTYSQMLTEFRATFLNIDKQILEELSDLFFGLWA